MKTRAAILVESRKPLVVDEIELPSPDVGQVLVKIPYTTICGAQLNEIDAVKGPDRFLPHLLGHEASGRVEEIGPGVSHVKPGDTVVVHWRPAIYVEAPKWSTPAVIWGRRPLNMGPTTTFSEHTIVAANRVTAIPADFDLKIASLLGCAVTTALGVVEGDAEVGPGDSVVVFGIGGVGLPIVRFAALAGARAIVVIDPRADRLAMAASQGATHWSDGLTDVDGFVRMSIDDVDGADVVIDTTGIPSVRDLACKLTRHYGTCVGVGVPQAPFNWMNILGKFAIQSHGGHAMPDLDIPRIIDMIHDGDVSLDGQITHEFSLDKINDAIDTMRSGVGGRILIDMGHEVKNTVQERKVCDFDQPIGF